jgi:hypothetical protein
MQISAPPHLPQMLFNFISSIYQNHYHETFLFALTLVFSGFAVSAQNEKLFLDFLKGQNGTGIELLKANSNFTQYES